MKNITKEYVVGLIIGFLITLPFVGCSSDFGFEQNNDLWQELKKVKNEKGFELVSHDIHITSSGAIILTGYFEEEKVNCGIAGVFDCRTYKIYRSIDDGKNWTDVTEPKFKADQEFLVGDKLGNIGLNKPAGLIKKVLSPFIYDDQFKVSEFNEVNNSLFHYIQKNIYKSNDDGLTWKKVTDKNSSIQTYNDMNFLQVFENNFVCKTRTNSVISVLTKNKNGIYKKLSGKHWDNFTIHTKSFGSAKLIKPGKPLSSNFYLNNGVLNNDKNNGLPHKVFEIVEMPNGDYYSTIESNAGSKLDYYFLWKSNDKGKSFTRVNICDKEHNRLADDIMILGATDNFLFLRSSEKRISKDRIPGESGIGFREYYILNSKNNKLSNLVFPEMKFAAGELPKLAFNSKKFGFYLTWNGKLYKSIPEYFKKVLNDKKYDRCINGQNYNNLIVDYDLYSLTEKALNIKIKKQFNQAFPSYHFTVTDTESNIKDFYSKVIVPKNNVRLSNINGGSFKIKTYNNNGQRAIIAFNIKKAEALVQVIKYLRNLGFHLITEANNRSLYKSSNHLLNCRITESDNNLIVEFAKTNHFLN